MNLTYLLGAGASANALPLISGMNERMQNFFNDINDKTGSFTSEELLNIQGLLDTIKNHYTVDTYAKKLFLKGESDLLLTNFLSAYLTYEQMSKEDNLNEKSFEKMNADEKANITKKIKTTLDYRYDSFFATILKADKGELRLPYNVNVVSWNYDFQIELSYMNYMNGPSLNEAQRVLNVFPSPNNHSIVDGRSKIIKLNGSAGFFRNGPTDDEKTTYESVFDYKRLKFSKETAETFKKMILQQRAFNDNSIKFSWIKDKQTDEARKQAQEILRKTNILVIIGYSFPYFNRGVDKDIFLGFEDKIKKIYLQTEPDSFQSIKNRMLGVSKHFINTEAFKELDQFLIPNEFDY